MQTMASALFAAPMIRSTFLAGTRALRFYIHRREQANISPPNESEHYWVNQIPWFPQSRTVLISHLLLNMIHDITLKIRYDILKLNNNSHYFHHISRSCIGILTKRAIWRFVCGTDSNNKEIKLTVKIKLIPRHCVIFGVHSSGSLADRLLNTVIIYRHDRR